MKYLILLLLSFNTYAYDCNSPKEDILKAVGLEFNRYNEVIVDAVCSKEYEPDLQLLLDGKYVTQKEVNKVKNLLGTK